MKRIPMTATAAVFLLSALVTDASSTLAPMHPAEAAFAHGSVHRTTVGTDPLDPSIKHHVHISHSKDLAPHPLLVHVSAANASCAAGGTDPTLTVASHFAFVVVGAPVTGLSRIESCVAAYGGIDEGIVTRVLDAAPTGTSTVTLRAAHHHELFDLAAGSGEHYFSAVTHRVESQAFGDHHRAVALSQLSAHDVAIARLASGARRSAVKPPIAVTQPHIDDTASSQSRMFHSKYNLSPFLSPLVFPSIIKCGVATMNVFWFEDACPYADGVTLSMEAGFTWSVTLTKDQYLGGGYSMEVQSCSAQTSSAYIQLTVPGCDFAGLSRSESSPPLTIVPDLIYAFTSPLASTFQANRTYNMPLSWVGCTQFPVTVNLMQAGFVSSTAILTPVVLPQSAFSSGFTSAAFTFPASVIDFGSVFLSITQNCSPAATGVKVTSSEFTLLGSGDAVQMLLPDKLTNVFAGQKALVTWAGSEPASGITLTLYEYGRISSTALQTVSLSQDDFNAKAYYFTLSSANAPTDTVSGYFTITYTPAGASSSTYKSGQYVTLIGTAAAIATITTPANFGSFSRSASAIPLSVSWTAGTSSDASAQVQLYQWNWFDGSTALGSASTIDMSVTNPNVQFPVSSGLLSQATANPSFFLRITGYNCLNLYVVNWCASVDSPTFFMPFSAGSSDTVTPTVSIFKCSDCTDSTGLCASCLSSGAISTNMSFQSSLAPTVKWSLNFNQYWWKASVVKLSLTEYALGADASLDGTLDLVAILEFDASLQLPSPTIRALGFDVTFYFFTTAVTLQLDATVKVTPILVLHATAVVRVLMPVNQAVTLSYVSYGSTNQHTLTVSNPVVVAPTVIAAGQIVLKPEISFAIAAEASAGPAASPWVSAGAYATAYVGAVLAASYPPLPSRTLPSTVLGSNAAACSATHLVDIDVTCGVRNMNMKYSAPFGSSGSTNFDDLGPYALYSACFIPATASVLPLYALSLPADLTLDFPKRVAISTAIASRLGVDASQVMLVSLTSAQNRRPFAAMEATATSTFSVYVVKMTTSGVSTAVSTDALAKLADATVVLPGVASPVSIAPATTVPTTPPPATPPPVATLPPDTQPSTPITPPQATTPTVPQQPTTPTVPQATTGIAPTTTSASSGAAAADSPSTPTGAIVGAVAASVVVIGLVGGFVVFSVLRRRPSTSPAAATARDGPSQELLDMTARGETSAPATLL